MSPDEAVPDRWLCACGEWTSVTHWAWPDGVGVHDPDLAFSEAAGLAQQGDSPAPTDGKAEATYLYPRCDWTLTDIYEVQWVCTLPKHDPPSLHNPVPVEQQNDSGQAGEPRV